MQLRVQVRAKIVCWLPPIDQPLLSPAQHSALLLKERFEAAGYRERLRFVPRRLARQQQQWLLALEAHPLPNNQGPAALHGGTLGHLHTGCLRKPSAAESAAAVVEGEANLHTPDTCMQHVPAHLVTSEVMQGASAAAWCCNFCVCRVCTTTTNVCSTFGCCGCRAHYISWCNPCPVCCSAGPAAG
jgi:hypothetical protein